MTDVAPRSEADWESPAPSRAITARRYTDPAYMAAEWERDDLTATRALVECGALSLDGLVTHQAQASDAPKAYRTAFEDPSCLKMILNWETPS